MKPILTVMPSRGRVEECKRAVDSFFSTSTKSDLIILVDEDDPQLLEYHSIGYLQIASRGTITQRINQAFQDKPDYQYYHISNDDVLYHTPQWDLKILQLFDDYGDGIAYGNDLFQGENLCTFPFISGPIAKSIGWLQMPLLNRYCGDLVWKLLGKNLNCLYYYQDIVIEHLHYLIGKGNHPVDMEIYQQDKIAFAQWLQKADLDIWKVRKMVQGVK